MKIDEQVKPADLSKPIERLFSLAEQKVAELDRSWDISRGAPVFTLVSGDVCSGLSPETFDLAIVGNVRSELQSNVLKTLDQSGKPV